MPSFPLDAILSHWSKLFEDFSTSSYDFYDAVEEGLARRKIPEAKTAMVQWSEGGVLSPNREYLRIEGNFRLVARSSMRVTFGEPDDAVAKSAVSLNRCRGRHLPLARRAGEERGGRGLRLDRDMGSRGPARAISRPDSASRRRPSLRAIGVRLNVATYWYYTTNTSLQENVLTRHRPGCMPPM